MKGLLNRNTIHNLFLKIPLGYLYGNLIKNAQCCFCDIHEILESSKAQKHSPAKCIPGT